MVEDGFDSLWSYGFAQEIHTFETDKSRAVSQTLRNVCFRGSVVDDQTGHCLRDLVATDGRQSFNSIFLN
jgi:hypothetical protein